MPKKFICASPVRRPHIRAITGWTRPHRQDLIASRMNIKEVCEYIGADSLGYLSLEGMLAAIGIDATSSCTACWTGAYPTLIANGQAA